MPPTRVIPTSATRPHVVYVRPEEINDVTKRIQAVLCPDPDDIRPARALWVPDLAHYGRNPVDWSEHDLPPEDHVLREFNIQPRSIVLPDPTLLATRAERIQAASSARHEITHFLGAGELEAIREQDLYLVRNGMPPRFRSDEERNQFIVEYYPEAEHFISAYSPSGVWDDFRAKITGDIPPYLRGSLEPNPPSSAPTESHDSLLNRGILVLRSWCDRLVRV